MSDIQETPEAKAKSAPKATTETQQLNGVAILGDGNRVEQYNIIINRPLVADEKAPKIAPVAAEKSKSSAAPRPAKAKAAGSGEASSTPVKPRDGGGRGAETRYGPNGLREGFVGSRLDSALEYPEGDIRNPLVYFKSPSADFLALPKDGSWEASEAYINPENELHVRSFTSSEGRVSFTQRAHGVLQVQFQAKDANGEYYTAIETNTTDNGFTGMRYGKPDANGNQVKTAVMAEDDGELSSLFKPWIGKDFHNNNIIAQTDEWKMTTLTGIDEVTRGEIQNFFANRPVLAGMVRLSDYPITQIGSSPVTLQGLQETEAKFQIRYDAIDQPTTPENGYTPNVGPRNGDLLSERSANRGPAG